MQEVKGWTVCDWESFSRQKKGHDKLVRRLKDIIRTKYHLKVRGLSENERRELWITTWLRGGKHHHHIIFEPDIIIRYGDKPEERVFVEYVNTEGKGSQNFLRDLRGMTALERAMNKRELKSLGFVLALRHSFAHKYLLSHPIHRTSKLIITSLKDLLNDLDRKTLQTLFIIA